jgi:hypothetical protein
MKMNDQNPLFGEGALARGSSSSQTPENSSNCSDSGIDQETAGYDGVHKTMESAATHNRTI